MIKESSQRGCAVGVSTSKKQRKEHGFEPIRRYICSTESVRAWNRTIRDNNVVKPS